jgi:hypothetical protein
MAYSAKVILDSINEAGNRLSTIEAVLPLPVWNEVLTHRALSRNAASSRAIPVEKQIQRVIDDPFIPVYWGKNQRGMQAAEELSPDEREHARQKWLDGRDAAAIVADELLAMGVHKQLASRVLAPYAWITALISATEWDNFLGLRQDWAIPSGVTDVREMFNPAFPAQPELQVAAYMIREALLASTPQFLEQGAWHLPLVSAEDYEGFNTSALRKISIGRAARISYLTHDGKRDRIADIDLHDKLETDHHLSPFEHVAYADAWIERSGNFTGGWVQYRKLMVGEQGRDPFSRLHTELRLPPDFPQRVS